jgi:hypothetical protein
MLRLLTLATALAGCASTLPFGTSMPSKDICSLGAFSQRLQIAPDFRVDRLGDHAFPSDAEVRRALAADAVEVARHGTCPGEKQLGELVMTVHRIEVGSTRDRLMKALSWSLLLLPTLGIISAYPISESKWITIELDAAIFVDGKQLWGGEFTSHSKTYAIQKELPSAGSELTALMKKAQSAAGSELQAALRRAK